MLYILNHLQCDCVTVATVTFTPNITADLKGLSQPISVHPNAPELAVTDKHRVTTVNIK